MSTILMSELRSICQKVGQFNVGEYSYSMLGESIYLTNLYQMLFYND